MIKLIKLIIVSLILLIADTLISVTISLVLGFILQHYFQEYHGTKAYLEGALFLNIARLVYYQVISILIFYLLNGVLTVSNKTVKFSIINCFSYVFLSVLYGFVFRPETKELFMHPIFFIIVLSTILSPVLLFRFSWFARLSDFGKSHNK